VPIKKALSRRLIAGKGFAVSGSLPGLLQDVVNILPGEFNKIPDRLVKDNRFGNDVVEMLVADVTIWDLRGWNHAHFGSCLRPFWFDREIHWHQSKAINLNLLSL